MSDHYNVKGHHEAPKPQEPEPPTPTRIKEEHSGVRISNKIQEGELKKRIQAAANRNMSEVEQMMGGAIRVSLKSVFIITDEAAKELFSQAHENCYWHNEGSCSEPDWRIYHSQPEECPLRKLEKWFGSAEA